MKILDPTTLRILIKKFTALVVGEGSQFPLMDNNY
jgi:hypothetical protein